MLVCRKVVWKHILNVYPDGMTGKERMDYIKKKANEYYALRAEWKDCIQKGKVMKIKDNMYARIYFQYLKLGKIEVGHHFPAAQRFTLNATITG